MTILFLSISVKNASYDKIHEKPRHQSRSVKRAYDGGQLVPGFPED